MVANRCSNDTAGGRSNPSVAALPDLAAIRKTAATRLFKTAAAAASPGIDPKLFTDTDVHRRNVTLRMFSGRIDPGRAGPTRHFAPGIGRQVSTLRQVARWFNLEADIVTQ
jgi:hypothetical protein